MTVFLFSYDERSLGSKELSRGLGCSRIRHTNSTFKGAPKHTVIIWGARTIPEEVAKCTLINRPELLERVVNKRDFFEMMNAPDGARIPPFTTDSKEAFSWIKEGVVVVARTKLAAKSGAGIVFLDSSTDVDEWVKAPLYTQYVKKAEEYRIHIAFGEVIDQQRKILRKVHPDTGEPIDPKTVDFRIRNLANGFIFAKQGLSVPDDVFKQAKKAMVKSGLDFGAVDVIYNKSQNKAYVLEINSAPGLENSTVENYVKAFKARLL